MKRDPNDTLRSDGADGLRQAWDGASVASGERRFRFAPEISDRSNGQGGAELVTRRASDIQPMPIRWLWPDRIARGKLTLIAGEPGLGKSQLTYAIIAAVTTGGRWPGCDERATIGNAIILSAEDDAADTIRPRLDAAGADASRVHIVSAVRGQDGAGRRPFNLQIDLELLERKIEEIGEVTLVAIDPVSSYLGQVDSHRNAELRAVLEPMGEMAGRLGVAILAVTHLPKNGSGPANNRFIGSIAFIAAARAGYVVCLDPENEERRLFLPTKNNLGPKGSGLGFFIGQAQIGSGITAPYVLWDTAPVTITANEALNQSNGDRSAPARTEAEDFLNELLAQGPMPKRRLDAEAEEAGITKHTLRRAKDALGVKATKTALDGGWCWFLPRDGRADPKVPNSDSVDTFENARVSVDTFEDDHANDGNPEGVQDDHVERLVANRDQDAGAVDNAEGASGGDAELIPSLISKPRITNSDAVDAIESSAASIGAFAGASGENANVVQDNQGGMLETKSDPETSASDGVEGAADVKADPPSARGERKGLVTLTEARVIQFAQKQKSGFGAASVSRALGGSGVAVLEGLVKKGILNRNGDGFRVADKYRRPGGR